MDREQARQEIRARMRCADYLKESKSGMYCCPYCNSGNGEHGTGALKVYEKTNTWTCHACKRSGDVIDLYRQITDLNYNEALSALAESIYITIDQYSPQGTTPIPQNIAVKPSNNDFSGADNKEHHKTAKTAQNSAEGQNLSDADYTEYYRQCRARLKDPEAIEYLQKRGISPETAAAYWIGYDPKADPAQAGHPSKRIIIPTTKAHYIGRSVDPKTPANYAKMNVKGGTPGIFNGRALYAQDVQEIFVVEGAFDALSVLEAGYTAISLNSSNNAKALLNALERQRTAATLILCPDSDQNPQTAERVKNDFNTIATGLKELNISYIIADINAGHKDANEALTDDKTSFLSALDKAQRTVARKPDNTLYYIDKLMSGEIERFRCNVKTGFDNLDAQSGGLYAGLYVLAAISSLGKTSFALQLADQLAERGHDVLYFSLEQSRLELVSKSIARKTAQNDMREAETSVAIRSGSNQLHVVQAIEDYKKAVADRMNIIEGNFSCNISFIGAYIKRHIHRNNTRPIVFVDYLQILQAAETTRSAKETIDRTITELKRISRDLDLTIIVICSVNRNNYLQPIDFEALKESGGIEYTADVVWGMQLQCLSERIFDEKEKIKDKRERIKKAKAENPRKIELVCLKNRYGIANYSCYYDYYPANDLFIPAKPARPEKDRTWNDAIRL